MDNSNIDPKVQQLVEDFSHAIIKPTQKVQASPSQILEAMLRQASLFASYNKLEDLGGALEEKAALISAVRQSQEINLVRGGEPSVCSECMTVRRADQNSCPHCGSEHTI